MDKQGRWWNDLFQCVTEPPDDRAASILKLWDPLIRPRHTVGHTEASLLSYGSFITGRKFFVVSEEAVIAAHAGEAESITTGTKLDWAGWEAAGDKWQSLFVSQTPTLRSTINAFSHKSTLGSQPRTSTSTQFPCDVRIIHTLLSTCSWRCTRDENQLKKSLFYGHFCLIQLNLGCFINSGESIMNWHQGLKHPANQADPDKPPPWTDDISSDQDLAALTHTYSPLKHSNECRV